MLQTTALNTTMGTLRPVIGSRGLVALSWDNRTDHVRRHLRRHLGTVNITEVDSLPSVARAMEAYFAGDTDALARLPVDPPGTSFQRMVWSALRTIPAGETWSYGELATAIGRPTACRAVAGANGANPVCLVIPCHRVIAAHGGLGGFSAGLARKRFLLRHEGVWPTQVLTG